ncbi:MAG: esterase/lipase family protein [Candidatus Sericytochromatia bacterium]
MFRRTALLLTATLAFAAPADAGAALPPVLLVHGIDDTGAIFEKLEPALRLAGRERVHTIDLAPNNGDVSLTELAAQVARKAEAICEAAKTDKLDLVGFSLGGMVSRYYIQRLGGAARVRRFVTISSPHGGTIAAYFRWNPGAADMRPGSPFLRELAESADTLQGVEMTTIWTPFDMMILPSWSSRVSGARERIVPVLSHPWMVRDDRACRAVVEALDGAGDIAVR